MTDIERIAREAGLVHCIDYVHIRREDWQEFAARFAALLIEECAKELDASAAELRADGDDRNAQTVDGCAEWIRTKFCNTP